MRKFIVIIFILFFGFYSQNCATWTEGCTPSGGHEWIITLVPGATINFDALLPASAWTVTQTGTNPEVWTIYAVDPDPNNVFSFAAGLWTISGPDCTALDFDIEAIDCQINGCPNCANPPCNITPSVPTNLVCNDEGTPSDPSDDTYTFDISINETSGNNNTWTANDPLNSSGTYGVVTMGPYLISAGVLNFTITDGLDATCSQMVSITPPATCSNFTNCVLTITDATEGVCNNNNTPYDPLDDIYDITVNASVVLGGASNQFNVSDGTNTFGPFTYGVGGTITLPADGNTYTLTFTDVDDLNCINTTTVMQNNCCEIDIVATPVNVTNTNNNDGEIQLCFNSGEAPFIIYLPSLPEATIYEVPGTCLHNYLISGLSQGSYDVTIIDALGCQTTINDLDIDAPNCTGFHLSDIVGQDALCNGSSDGTLTINLLEPGDATSITVDVGQGFPPITYTDLENPLVYPDLPAGQYFVALFDNNGCEVTYLFNPVAVNEPTVVTSTATPTSTTAVGVADGQIEVCANGGTPDYTVTIEPNVGIMGTGTGTCQGNFLITEVPAGTYNVITTDANGCADTLVIVVNDPTCPLTIENIQIIDLDCGGESNGILNLSIVDGVEPYSISLDGGVTFSPTQTSPDFMIDNLSAGEYDMIVMDGNGCSVSHTSHIEVNENPIITLDENITHVAVPGVASGSIDFCINGGVEPYTVTVDPNTGNLLQIGGTADCADSYSLDNLPAGVYNITVTDDLGCSQTFAIEVLEPTCPGFTIDDITANDVSCFGANNGSIDVSLNGGTGPFTYQLTGIQTVTTTNNTHSFVGLDNGEYELVIIDSSLPPCSLPYTSTIIINEPEALTSNITVIPPCAGMSNGMICLIPENGTPDYSYNVELDGEPQIVVAGPHPDCPSAEFHVPNLASGTYFIELIDGNGCVAHSIYTVSDVEVVTGANITPDCTGQTVGAIDLSVAGYPEYTYEWSTTETTEDISNLENGTYTVTVTDSRGCTVVSPITVDLQDMVLNFGIGETCIEQNAGVIITSVANGVPQYEFAWSNGTTTSNETLSNLAIGTYTVTVTDSRGCIAESSTEVTEYDMVADMIVENTCVGQNNGFASATPIQGIPNFQYQWSNGSSDATITDLTPNTYSVTITDVNGCTAINEVTVEEYELIPNLQIQNVCTGDNSGSISVSVENATAPVDYQWSNNAKSINRSRS